MSIELHCSKCGKLIRAPDHAGGKHGKCPYCKESVYVPMTHDDGDEIGLAPIDKEEQRRAEELRRESTKYIAAVGHEVGPPQSAGSGAPSGSTDEASGAGAPPRPGDDLAPGEIVDFAADVQAFIAAMRDSKLDEAEQVTERLRQAGKRARDYVQGMLLDEVPPAIEDVPPPLVQGFVKTLLNRLS